MTDPCVLNRDDYRADGRQTADLFAGMSLFLKVWCWSEFERLMLVFTGFTTPLVTVRTPSSSPGPAIIYIL